jgi:hypothetical protein
MNTKQKQKEETKRSEEQAKTTDKHKAFFERI